jgi:hypothetical protein
LSFSRFSSWAPHRPQTRPLGAAKLVTPQRLPCPLLPTSSFFPFFSRSRIHKLAAINSLSYILCSGFEHAVLPLASNTSFTEQHGKPSRTPTLPCFPCCVILACSKVGSWD